MIKDAENAAIALKAMDYSVVQQCMHCGMCLPVCPTYQESRKERHSPRGRIALMRAIADDELPLDEEFAREMDYCLGCLACQTACPANVDYAQLFEAARASSEEIHAHPRGPRNLYRTLTLRLLFRYPSLLRLTGKMMYWSQRTGLQSWFQESALFNLFSPHWRRLIRMTPAIEASPSFDQIGAVESPDGSVRYRTGLLVGCIQDIAYPSVNRDTADVLLANGCEVITPRQQGCCGSIHGHNGETDLARHAARRNIDAFDLNTIDAIITNAGGCGSHLRHYGRLLKDDPKYATKAHLWDSKVHDIHEWLIKIGTRPPESPASLKQRVTYHDSCHLSHGQRITQQPRMLLQLIPGIELVELPEAQWCCGSAGVYSITQPETSDALLRRKVNNILATKAEILATSNPGCDLQIQRGLKDVGHQIRVTTPVSLLAEAYRRENRRKTDASSLR